MERSMNVVSKLGAGLALVLPTLGCAQMSLADPFSDIKTYQRDVHDRTVTKCDELAAHHSDPERVTDGVTQEAMDKPAAINACLIALKTDPENPRLNYQLARAYGYSGLHEDGDPYRVKALNAGYPQSLFVVGYIRIEGWDGREPDVCYGGELVRRSAEAGRFAGLVGFPHYVQTGRFQNCDTYPVIEQEQMQQFLDRAETQAADYYQRILVKSLKANLTSEGDK